MSNHYFTGRGGKAVTPLSPDEPTAEELCVAVETFLRSCRQPAALEHGEELLPIGAGEWSTEMQSGRLLLHVLTRDRSLSRRILAIERRQSGALHCRAERFGARTVKLTLLDLARPQAEAQTLRARRASFGERFRRLLLREFPGWEIATLSAEMDLTRSLSPVFPRALLERRGQSMVAMACPTLDDEPALLTFALVWHSLASGRLRAKAALPRGLPLQLFLPSNAGTLTAQRLKWLDPRLLTCRLFRFNEHGSAGEVDPADLGNLECEVVTPQRAPGVLSGPEAVMEVVVRANLERIDASLVASTLRGEVINRAGHAAGRVDLLCLSESGEPVVLELKAKEDIHLAVQGLDYWSRMAGHAIKGDLDALFPGYAVQRVQPRLLLVAPAMAFHPSIATVIRYFSPSIRVERVGLNLEWQQGLKVVMRLAGSRDPASHERPGRDQG